MPTESIIWEKTTRAKYANERCSLAQLCAVKISVKLGKS